MEITEKTPLPGFLMFRVGRNWRLAEQKDPLAKEKYQKYQLSRIKSWRPVIFWPELGRQNGNPTLGQGKSKHLPGERRRQRELELFIQPASRSDTWSVQPAACDANLSE